jgi:hypothetical protein
MANGRWIPPLERDVTLRGAVARPVRLYEAWGKPDKAEEWLVAEGNTLKHADEAANRVRRLVAVMLALDVAWLDHRPARRRPWPIKPGFRPERSRRSCGIRPWN